MKLRVGNFWEGLDKAGEENSLTTQCLITNKTNIYI